MEDTMTHSYLRDLCFLGQNTNSSNTCSLGGVQHWISSFFNMASLPLPSLSQTFRLSFPLGISSKACWSGELEALCMAVEVLGLAVAPFLCQWPLQANKLNMDCPGDQ